MTAQAIETAARVIDPHPGEELTPGRFVVWFAYNALFTAGVAYPLGIVVAWAAMFALGETRAFANLVGMLIYTYLMFIPVIVGLIFFYVPFAMALSRWNPRLRRRWAFALSAVAIAVLTILMLDLRNGAAPSLGSAATLLALALGVRLTPVPPRGWAWLVGIIPVSAMLTFALAFVSLWTGL